MAVVSCEGVVEGAKIRLKSDVKLPENMKVYVVVPEQPAEKNMTIRINTPHLVQRAQASDFEMKISKE